ncbi:MAG TPA: hypothetical protein EYQ39_07265 [Gemmatimonadetes bacterium]|nr:hypothetical protein [Gemmatimonadota bacterium]
MKQFIRTLVLALVISLVATPSGAQSLYNAAGMGLPVEAIDGRARALGNLGIGLWGSGLLPGDPAASGMFIVPTAVIVGQPSWVDYDHESGNSGSIQGSRFPLMGIGYPGFSGIFTVSLSSFLDQHYKSQRSLELDLRGEKSEVTDLFEQDGSIGSLNFGYSRPIGTNAALGFSFGRYTGSILRQLERDFSTLSFPGALESYQTSSRWTYSGTSLTGGMAANLGTVARVAASVTWSGDLNATASDDTRSMDRNFSLPMQYRLGTSIVLAPGFMITASAIRADWADIERDLDTPTTVGSTSNIGVGVELSRANIFGLALPLRFGYRTGKLPFSLGSDVATERIFSAGLGLSLSQADDIVLGGVDAAIERGRRSGSVLSEAFWRATISLRVSGY